MRAAQQAQEASDATQDKVVSNGAQNFAEESKGVGGGRGRPKTAAAPGGAAGEQFDRQGRADAALSKKEGADATPSQNDG